MCRCSHDAVGVTQDISSFIVAEAVAVASSKGHPLAGGNSGACSVDRGSS
jgi:hypothetical protein